MGTKKEPGKFDCYTKALPDEPIFVLLGRDPHAGFLIDLWATRSETLGGNPEKIAEARRCAEVMRTYCKEQGKQPYGWFKTERKP